MTWTYLQPIATPKDEVRFWSGDTVETTQSMSDEEIAYILASLDNQMIMCAAQVCRMIGDKFAQLATGTVKAVGPFRLQSPNMTAAKVWYARADRLATGSVDGSFSLGSMALFTGQTTPAFAVGMIDPTAANAVTVVGDTGQGLDPVLGI
jgi:hypothetical protein